jgi:hypothetical protein
MPTNDNDAFPVLTGMELADAVEAVRAGLMAGAVRGAGSGVRFEVGEIHMEFTVQLERVRAGRGGVKAWVVEAGAESTRTTGHTHTVSFTLRPKDADDQYLVIGPPRDGEAPSLSYEG